MAFFDQPENTSGALGTRFSQDAFYIKGAVGDAMAAMIQNLTTLIAGYVIALTASWKLALVITACVPIMLVAGAVSLLVVNKMLLAMSRGPPTDAASLVASLSPHRRSLSSS